MSNAKKYEGGGTVDTAPKPDTTASGRTMKDFIDSKGKPRKDLEATPLKKGGPASSRADGVAQRGKTRGKVC